MKTKEEAKLFGAIMERVAADYLHNKGYTILEQNLKIGNYELDIVARDKDCIVFVEVKARSYHIDPIEISELIPADKEQRIVMAADSYMQYQSEPCTHCRFDYLLLSLPTQGKTEVEHYQDVILPSAIQ